MNIAEAKDYIKDTVEAYLAKDEADLYRIDPARQRPVFLLGAPGIGKTAIMTQIAHELGIGLVSYSMTHHTRQSALGLPFIVNKNYGGVDYEVSEYTMSEIIASVYEFQRQAGIFKGILFLDEINCVSETLYPSMLQFLQFKTFGRHRIPENWIVVCAGNPPEYNRSVHEFDIVTLDRLRRIEVEPDYAAWKAYAVNHGIHPAILSFLEINHDNFYSVESTPEGKKFVTARGWDDMSECITLFEDMNKRVDRNLIVQFLQDDEIAERFSLYYDLFKKYRSDYQVDRILSGTASDEIVERARAAAFDERLALIGLMLDSLCGTLAKAVEKQEILVDVRDILRKAKPQLLNGTLVNKALGTPMHDRQESLTNRKRMGTISVHDQRIWSGVIKLLKKYAGSCELARIVEGEAAFSIINGEYGITVKEMQDLIAEAQSQLDASIDFIDETFGNDREMLVFITELTSRTASTQFITRFGNDKYYAHNSALMVDDNRTTLLDEMATLDLDSLAIID